MSKTHRIVQEAADSFVLCYSISAATAIYSQDSVHTFINTTVRYNPTPGDGFWSQYLTAVCLST